jgi:hypothetical protein
MAALAARRTRVLPAFPVVRPGTEIHGTRLRFAAEFTAADYTAGRISTLAQYPRWPKGGF